MGYLFSVIAGLAPIFMWPLFIIGHAWEVFRGISATLWLFTKAQLLFVISIVKHLLFGVMGRYSRASFIKPMMLAHSPYVLTSTRGALLLKLREEGDDDADVETMFVKPDEDTRPHE